MIAKHNKTYATLSLFLNFIRNVQDLMVSYIVEMRFLSYCQFILVWIRNELEARVDRPPTFDKSRDSIDNVRYSTRRKAIPESSGSLVWLGSPSMPVLCKYWFMIHFPSSITSLQGSIRMENIKPRSFTASINYRPDIINTKSVLRCTR